MFRGEFAGWEHPCRCYSAQLTNAEDRCLVQARHPKTVGIRNGEHTVSFEQPNPERSLTV